MNILYQNNNYCYNWILDVIYILKKNIEKYSYKIYFLYGKNINIKKINLLIKNLQKKYQV